MRASERGEIGFRAGQVWRYRSRPHEPDSTLTVLRLTDDRELGRLIHVRIEGLTLKDPSAEGGVVDSLPHAVFAEESLRNSVTQLVGQVEPPPEDEGWYEAWRAGYEEGEAQISEETVAGLLDLAEEFFGG